MDESEFGIFSPSPPSSVPAVLAFKGIAPETALAACGGAWVSTCSEGGRASGGAQLTVGDKITCIALVDR